MGMLDIHKEALESEHPMYHEFLSCYKKLEKTIHAFVEGKEDPIFYRGAIEFKIGDDWNVFLYPCGSKDNVLKIYSDFDWKIFNKFQIIFMIDRDLSVFIDDIKVKDINLYVTSQYSIENDIVNDNTCERVLLELYNLSKITRDDLDNIKTKFNEELLNFKTFVKDIMIWIIYWKRNGNKPCLNNIHMNHLYRIRMGKIECYHNHKYMDYIEYIHSQCGIPLDRSIDLTDVETEFLSKNGIDYYIRGKYLLWFFLDFVKNIYNNITKFSKTILVKPKIHINMGLKNAMILIGPRTRIPSSFQTFLDNTIMKYKRSFLPAT